MDRNDIIKSELVEIGVLLRELRKKKKIKQIELFTGLCTKEVYERIEKGKGMPNELLIERLFSRLHIQHRLLERTLSEKDFMQKEQRFAVERCIKSGRFNEAKEVLDKYVKTMKDGWLEKQYVLWKQAQLVENSQSELAGEWYYEAFRMTMKQLDYKIISEEELDMYLGYRRCLCPMQEHEELELLTWIESSLFPEQIYPWCYFKTGFRIAEKLFIERQYETAARICNRCLKSLQAGNKGYMLLDLLFLRAKCSAKIEDNKEKIYHEYLTVYYTGKAFGDEVIAEAVKKYCVEEYGWHIINAVRF